ncbi:hypothetical protein NYE69_19395 [Paenibacillus sp. FSL R5-0527]|uniref:hypothetical protein n=1 Tax=Paenibacillus sp. FSL R5-0527 TaxID=2975321 RepID=UPI00097A5FD3|nr:hypothetical protein BK140_01325 [Paenibacillus macerans]
MPDIQQKVEQLSAYGALLKQEIEGLGSEILNCQTEICERSISGIIYHLDYHEQLFATNYIRSLLYLKEPRFQSFVDEEEWNTYAADTTMLQLASFQRERARNCELLLLSYPHAWSRKGLHEKRGPVNLQYTVDSLLMHDEYHLLQIQKIKQSRIDQNAC